MDDILFKMSDIYRLLISSYPGRVAVILEQPSRYSRNCIVGAHTRVFVDRIFYSYDINPCRAIACCCYMCMNRVLISYCSGNCHSSSPFLFCCLRFFTRRLLMKIQHSLHSGRTPPCITSPLLRG